jgi:hypothetical protein
MPRYLFSYQGRPAYLPPRFVVIDAPSLEECAPIAEPLRLRFEGYADGSAVEYNAWPELVAH